jgi:hypothetical protein
VVNRHEAPEPLDADTYLIVSLIPECFAYWDVYPGGRPMLVIDYGGAQLMLEVVEPQDAEVFALSLARTALSLASHCRYLMGGAHS